MRPIRTLFALFFFGLLPAATFAVEIVVHGPVVRVDPAGATLTLGTRPNPRTVAVEPSAIITVNGARTTLELLPLGGEAFLIAEKDLAGNLHATRITVSHDGPAVSAAYPPGSLVAGIVMGIDAGTGTMTVRTAAGDQRVPLGSAPIVIAGRRVPLTQVAVGDAVRIRRVLLPGGTDRITDMIWITGGERVAGYRSTMPAAPGARAVPPPAPRAGSMRAAPPAASAGHASPPGWTAIRIREVPARPSTKPGQAPR